MKYLLIGFNIHPGKFALSYFAIILAIYFRILPLNIFIKKLNNPPPENLVYKLHDLRSTFTVPLTLGLSFSRKSVNSTLIFAFLSYTETLNFPFINKNLTLITDINFPSKSILATIFCYY